MTDKTLREEIANIISRPGAFYILNGGAPFWYNESFEERTDAILALIRQTVEEAKPTKMRKHESAVGFVQGYNQALKDFTDNLEKIWR